MDAGGVNGQLNNYDRAVYYFNKAYTLKPDSAPDSDSDTTSTSSSDDYQPEHNKNK